ncbi:MAG: hypothetical protein LBG11_06065 [Bifidobacteriaceae bacterium]|jgi:hypothetical protein|nr:hypothetical protein [Bifidobacteriaceae bacterium]
MVKLSGTAEALDTASARLRKVAAKMRSAPRFLAVVTGTGPSYQRPDGVFVLPLAALTT